jgi:hypothetical protein
MGFGEGKLEKKTAAVTRTIGSRAQQCGGRSVRYRDTGGERRQVWGFAITLGYSRRMWAQAALDQKPARH